MELGGFSAAEADELRRAIGFTRSQERLDRMRAKLGDALKKNNVSDAAAAHILKSLASFALYGFPESHAISFALIAYASAWLKVHRPAAFYAALINCQPMGFYSPASLVQDARRHEVKFLPVCVVNSDKKSRVDTDNTIRLGFASVNGLRADNISALLATRKARPFESMADFMRRTKLSAAERRVLSGAGALNALAGHRRAALWQVEAVNAGDDLFRHAITNDEATPSPLKQMTHLERVQADFTHLSLTTGAHPMKLLRDKLPGILSTADLRNVRHGERVKIAGTVTCRQRPGTAKGFCFITLEDETGTANAIVRPGLFEKARLIINLEPALIITGKVQNEQGVIHVMAVEIAELPNLGLPAQTSHDFR
jgi:error-prone DNA polymerase